MTTSLENPLITQMEERLRNVYALRGALQYMPLLADVGQILTSGAGLLSPSVLRHLEAYHTLLSALGTLRKRAE